MVRTLAVAAVMLGLSACQCGEPDLVRSYGDVSADGGPRPDSGIVFTPVDSGVVTQPPNDAGVVTSSGSCLTDCDCPPNQRCVGSGGELSLNSCQSGTSTCTATCPGGCAQGQVCTNGVCELPPCVGTNCTSTFSTSVQGKYATYYELDIHDFANSAGNVLKLLDLLNAALSGQGAQCQSQSTPEGKLMCYVVNLIGQNIHAPPWVGQLITVLSDAFKFGNKPVRAKGTMQLAEGANAKLYAAEVWSEMWLDYNGQSLNVMNSPQLGANGQVTVTVPAFAGTRTATEVFLGPRSIEFDVNKLIVNMLGVVISAASGNKAHDIESLLDLVLCANLSTTSQLLCQTAAHDFAKNFDLSSGLGGAHITQQRATIYDLDSNNIADALGLPNARGSLTGEMSNGFVSGAFGPFPASSWYGTK